MRLSCFSFNCISLHLKKIAANKKEEKDLSFKQVFNCCIGDWVVPGARSNVPQLKLRQVVVKESEPGIWLVSCLTIRSLALYDTIYLYGCYWRATHWAYYSLIGQTKHLELNFFKCQKVRKLAFYDPSPCPQGTKRLNSVIVFQVQHSIGSICVNVSWLWVIK